MLYEQVSNLEIKIDECQLTLHQRDTSSGFTRVTTVVALTGDNETGYGEDVTYDDDDHQPMHHSADELDLTGTYTLEDFSRRLSEIDLFFGTEPSQAISRNYRQWAFESAALDLGLKQANTTLSEQLDREYQPVHFVVSTRLDDPSTGDRVINWLDRNPDVSFKLDPTSAWTADTIDRLAATNAVRILDLKGQYQGTVVDQPADPELYQQVIDAFPDALIEDPALTEETRPLFDGHEHRVTWDYPVQSVSAVEQLPIDPEWLNIKPSRFGSVHALFKTIDYCSKHDIQMFAGGQFELDVGREHIHAIASLFYPEAPNDAAPKGYNDPNPDDNLPTSPLAPPHNPRGLSWRS